MLVFDSGLGGLTVLREVGRMRPDLSIVYLADDAFFPYGGRDETVLVARVLSVFEEALARHQPDLAVIACNTASTVALPQLRARFPVPFVGTVPAIKPACLSSITRQVTVLGTEATVQREYTRALIRDYGQGCHVTLVGSPRLAVLAEAALNGQAPSDGEIAAEIAPCFVDADGARTDTVVLACTHYPLLLDRFTALAPWPVNWIDPAPAIARRVSDLLGLAIAAARGAPLRFEFTSGAAPSPALGAALAGFGFAEPAQAARPRPLRLT